MHATALVFTAFGALCLSSAASSNSLSPDALKVHVNLNFDRSIERTILSRTVQDEAAAIWRVHGVELVWSESAADVDMHLDAIVIRYHIDGVNEAPHRVLGRTILDSDGLVRGPIRVLFDPIESLVRRQDGADALMRDHRVARALGRVLAHEIGHALLGAPYHDRAGLMRPTFPVDEMTGLDRTSFRLAHFSASRLRARIARLADTRDADRRGTCSVD